MIKKQNIFTHFLEHYQQSGLNLTAPPFNFKVKKEKELLSTVLKDGKSKIVTTLYEVC